MIAGNFIHRNFYLGTVGSVDGILARVRGIIDEVSGNDHALGIQDIDSLSRSVEKRVGLHKAGSGVPEPDLRVCHLDESELREPRAARCQKAKCHE